MSVELRPKFNPKVKGLTYMAEGKALAAQLMALHEFSTELGIRSIAEFVNDFDPDGDDEPPEDDEDEDDYDDNDSDDDAEWHSPQEGLIAVQALRTAVEEDPEAADRWNEEDPDGLETLLEDLDELIRCLKKASSTKSTFRLTFG